MNKKMSRFISALLVVAMVCAMVPAVFAAVTGVTIKNAPTEAIFEGTVLTLTAEVTKENEADEVPALQWASSDATVASVDASTGVVTALKEGTATITVTAGEKSASCNIKVAPKTPTSYTVRPITLSVGKGISTEELCT